MTGRRPASESPADSFWPNPPRKLGKIGTPPPSPLKKQTDLKVFLHPVDDAPEFHDPYSELNLFLSQKVKEECKQYGFVKKWSLYFQEKLIEKITPEFQKKFPHYRLGVTALKKTWEKVLHYSEQIQTQKEALTTEGKLNISFLIKENLKQYLRLKIPSEYHPYKYAHQLALKISDCIATVDGVKPMLDHLARTIWYIQRHVLSGPSVKSARSPYDEMDKIDKLIVKSILEILGKNPQASQKELESAVKEHIHSLQELPSFASLDKMTATISCLLAEKIYATSSFHTALLLEQKNALFHFIRSHLTLYKKASQENYSLSEIVRRVKAFYQLAVQLPKDLSKEELTLDNHLLPQVVLAFISQESRLVEKKEEIFSLYEETKHLPALEEDILEMVVWKIVSQQDSLLDLLTFRIGQKIEEEIAHILIDNPHLTFTTVVHTTVQFFRKAKELFALKSPLDLEKKITLWTIQGDLLCRWLLLDQENSVLKLICSLFKEKRKNQNHASFINHITQVYLNLYPQHAPHLPQVTARISILYKYAWYALFSSSEESSLERFLKWHFVQLTHLPEEQLFLQIEEICKRAIPLIPFDKEQCIELFAREKKEIQSEENQRQA